MLASAPAPTGYRQCSVPFEEAAATFPSRISVVDDRLTREGKGLTKHEISFAFRFEIIQSTGRVSNLQSYTVAREYPLILLCEILVKRARCSRSNYETSRWKRIDQEIGNAQKAKDNKC